MNYYFQKTVSKPFDDIVLKVSENLKKEGFGIITTIDLKKTFSEKLNINYKKYIILGACNPSFAHQALSLEKYIGLMLPCNVVIREIEDNLTDVSSIDPLEMMKGIGNPELNIIVQIIQKKLKEVIMKL